MPYTRKPRAKSYEAPSRFDYGQYIYSHEVFIKSEGGRATFQTQFATYADIQALFGCSRATAFRLMRQLPVWHVTDESDNQHTRRYIAVELRHIDKIKRGRRGNPGFLDGDYQSRLARRPRKSRA